MTTVNIISDVATATKVPNKALTELVDKENLCIGSAIKDAIDAKEDILVCNIGVGTLSISIKDMQCKFVPSNDLKNVIKRSIAVGVDPLELALEQSLVDKLVKVANEAF